MHSTLGTNNNSCGADVHRNAAVSCNIASDVVSCEGRLLGRTGYSPCFAATSQGTPVQGIFDTAMNKVLIANRGEIALRIIKTCTRLGIATVAVYSDIDRDAPHVKAASEAICLGPAALESSYLNMDAVLAAVERTGADAIHPGYGFLSENAAFAERVVAAGVTWIGPPPAAMLAMASKARAREIAQQNEVPVIPATVVTAETALEDRADLLEMELPLLLKASAGGGGIGMREVHDAANLIEEIEAARDHALRQFGDGDLLVERLVAGARHIEVQVLADQHGNLLHLFERDCSIQRRRQKLIEEAPAVGLADQLRQRLYSAALALARAVDYEGVGTVEFLVLGDEFFLLEMNTRLQVEHGVTEAVTGLDLVELQIQAARGDALQLTQADIACEGHAIEARIYAETPAMGFAPATGVVEKFVAPEGAAIRVDTGVLSGSQISHYYDGLLCKLITTGASREQATRQMDLALRQLCVFGVATNQSFLSGMLMQADWCDANCHVSWLEDNLNALIQSAQPSEQALATALAVATVAQFIEQPTAADARPWPGGFRIERRTQWQWDESPHGVNWRWRAADEFGFPDYGLEVKLLSQEPGAAEMLVEIKQEIKPETQLAAEISGQRYRFLCQRTGDRVWVWCADLGSLCVQRVEGTQNTDSEFSGGRCLAHGPGQVLRVLVSAQQQVAKGDPLVVIESMKMESTLTAVVSGTVAAVAVAAGDLIESGQMLLQTTPQGEDT